MVHYCFVFQLLLGMLSEIRRSLNVINGVMAACKVFAPSVSYFLAISIVGMVKGELPLFYYALP